MALIWLAEKMGVTDARLAHALGDHGSDKKAAWWIKGSRRRSIAQNLL